MNINEEKCMKWINSLLSFAKETVKLSDEEREYASDKILATIKKYRAKELNEDDENNKVKKETFNMSELIEAKKWINERLSYITTNCDLKDTDNKRAYNGLRIASECVEQVLRNKKIEGDC